MFFENESLGPTCLRNCLYGYMVFTAELYRKLVLAVMKFPRLFALCLHGNRQDDDICLKPQSVANKIFSVT